MVKICRKHARYSIVSVTNSRKEKILHGNDIEMANYKIETVSDYVKYRMNRLGNKSEFTIKFQTPLSIKYQGEMIKTFFSDAFSSALRRRIFIMDCFEGIDTDIMERDILTLPEFEVISCRERTVKRFSERKMEKTCFSGLEGEVRVRDIDKLLMPYVLAGEILNIGKNTSFGFGRYILF